MKRTWVGALSLCAAIAACSDQGQNNPARTDLGTQAPEIIRFTASSDTVDEGQTVVLAWSTANTGRITIEADALDPLLTDSLRLNSTLETPPLVTETTFTLTAEGEGGVETQSVTVGVEVPNANEPPRIARFRVSPEVYQGRVVSARVTWTATGQLTLTANGAPVEGFESSGFGALEIDVDESRTIFELQAERANQVEVATATITRAPEEVEPNDSPENAAVPSQGRGIGELTSQDRDYWVVEAPENGRIFAEVTGLFESCPFDSNLALFSYDPETNEAVFLTQNDDISAERLCSRIDPSADAAARGLEAGLYLLLVTGRGADEVGDYELIVEVSEGACGNGDIEFGRGEACDDGNLDDGDGCSATCSIEPLFALQGRARDSGQLSLIEGQEAIVEINRPERGAVGASLEGCDDAMLELLDAERLEGNDYRRLARGECGLPPRAVPAGRYLLRIVGPPGGLGPSTLTAQSAPKGCGDLMIDLGESCDDGNIAAGDGCSDTCRAERQAIIPGSENRTVTFPAAGYQSWAVQVTSDAGGSVRARPQSQTCTGPTRITLFDRGQVLGAKEATDDCAEIRPAEGDDFAAGLPAGLYDLAFESLDGTVQTATYGLQNLGAACNNGILERRAGEQCESGDPKCGPDCRVRLEPFGDIGLQTGDEIEYYRVGVGNIELGRISVSLALSQPPLNSQVLIELFDEDFRLLARSPLNNNIPRTPFTSFVARRDPNSPPIDYLVRVSRPNQAGPVPPPYSVNGNVSPPSCGNNFVEPGELCDDGNQVDRDGCTSGCTFEQPTISEDEDLFLPETRNDDFARAKSLAVEPGVALTPVGAQLVPVGDVDFYSFVVPEGVVADFRSFTNSVPTADRLCNPGAQGRLTLFDDGRTVLVDEFVEGECPDIDGISEDSSDLRARSLTQGRYFIRFDRPQGGTASSYSLFVILR